jgi:hypothetical protein
LKRILFASLAIILLGIVPPSYAQQASYPGETFGNIAGLLFASNFSHWTIPQGTSPTNSQIQWSSPKFCQVTSGGVTFNPFAVGSPITIVDADTANTEVVVVTAYSSNNYACQIQAVMAHTHYSYHITSATGGLQEAINFSAGLPYQVVITPDWIRDGGTTSMITNAKGNSQITITDERSVPPIWYQWNGTIFVAVGGGGGGGQFGTLPNDLVTNNATNTQAQDANIFVAGPAGYTAQQAINAAAANSGSAMIQPNAGRVPFTNTGNYRVIDQRTDVPATARSATEFGVTADTRVIYGFLTQGSTAFSCGGCTLTSPDVGKMLVAVGTVSGIPTAFESVVTAITDSLHGTLTTAAPFNQSTQHAMTLGHDDTAAVTQAMNAVGDGGTLVFPEGITMTHTQVLRGQSPIGLGFNSSILGFPGEDIFQAPDPSQTTGVNQGLAHIHDLTFLVESRIDATAAWQIINDSGTTAKAAVYRPIGQRTSIANNPCAPGWMQNCVNGVGSINSGSPTLMTVPAGVTLPVASDPIIFPYLSTIFTTTIASVNSGTRVVTLNASYPGATNTQAEWFSGSSVQKLNASIGSGSCPASITLSNSITPIPGWESNVAAFGLIQIDGEQFSYFAKTNAGNTSPANTLYNIQCAQNGTSRAAHSASATVFPLNQYRPSYPWPVTPTINGGDTTPSTTAGFYPAWDVGNAAFSFPVQVGVNTGTGAWSANSKIENLSFFPWPNDIFGYSWQSVNHTAAMYMVQPSYATTFANLYGLYLFYGIAEGPPSLESGIWFGAQPTGDGTHWDGITMYAANPVNISVGNQTTFSNFNVYSSEGLTNGASYGADTCYFFTPLWNDQTGGYGSVVSLAHFKNLYCEPENASSAPAPPYSHDTQMPQWEWDTINSEIEDQHMGGGGEVAIGGSQQHWIGGNFNNAISTPTVIYGNQNTADYAVGLGSVPASNFYSDSSVINFGWGNRFDGTTSQSFSTPTGPYGNLTVGSMREPIRAQTEETFNTGNLTVPYVSSEGGLITPEEFNTSGALESNPMSVGWTYDSTSPVTSSYTGCNVGNNLSSSYCVTSLFNSQGLPIGSGQRLVPGKYTLFMSVKDATTASNSTTIKLFSNCGSYLQSFSVPLTNTWSTTPFTAAVDFTSVTGGSTCYLGMQFFGATTADQVQIGYVNFAPVWQEPTAYNFNLLNALYLNGVPGTPGQVPTVQSGGNLGWGSGGSTNPAGTNGAFQYNNAGVFGGVVITGPVEGNGTSAPSAATSPQLVTALNTSPSTTLAVALLPLATGTTFGAIKPDGTSCTVSAGILACTGSGGGITTLTGDVNASGSGSVAATVKGINGTIVSGLGSGLYYNTTGTGVPSIATSPQVVAALNNSPSTQLLTSLLPSNVTLTICSGTITLSGTIGSVATGSIGSATCTGLVSTDTILITSNTNIFGVTGFLPTANGILTLSTYPTTNTINVVAENNTSGSITISGPTVNYRVVR